MPADRVQGLQHGRQGQCRLAQPPANCLAGVCRDHQQVKRKVAIGIAARLAGLITVTGRPAKWIDRRAKRIERRRQIGRQRHAICHPNDEPLVGVDVLEPIPVDVPEPQHGSAEEEKEKRET